MSLLHNRSEDRRLFFKKKEKKRKEKRNAEQDAQVVGNLFGLGLLRPEDSFRIQKTDPTGGVPSMSQH